MSAQRGEINIRRAAADVIGEVLENGEYSDRALAQKFAQYPQLTKQDRSFLTRLCMGCIERKITLDYCISLYSKTPIVKLKPFIRSVLRMTAYQLLFMEQVTDFAACDEAVEIVRKRGLAGLAGYVNAVCRNIAREKDVVLKKISELKGIKRLSVMYSMPEWIIKDWEQQGYGLEDMECAFKHFLEQKDTCIRCNESVCAADNLYEALNSAGITAKRSNVLAYCFKLSGYDRLSTIEQFRSGAFTVQDESSALVGQISGIKPGDTVLDLCAAPGGKTLHAADRLRALEGRGGTHGHVTACDISEGKVKKIKENIERCRFENISVMVNDALKLKTEFLDSADVVIADVPCSGLGIIGKKPDIKYRVQAEDMVKLSELSRAILKNAVRYVKPGGTLIFSTCTVSTKENVENFKFLCEQGFCPVSLDEYLPEQLKCETSKQGYLQLLPGKYGTDGFFISKLARTEL